MVVVEKGWGGVNWIDLTEDKDQLRALVNAVMNLRVLLNADKLLNGYTTGGHSSSADLHRVIFHPNGYARTTDYSHVFLAGSPRKRKQAYTVAGASKAACLGREHVAGNLAAGGHGEPRSSPTRSISYSRLFQIIMLAGTRVVAPPCLRCIQHMSVMLYILLSHVVSVHKQRAACVV
jgi:hypothetical protein